MDKICEQLIKHVVDNYDSVVIPVFEEHVPDMQMT